MSKTRVIVLSVVEQDPSRTETMVSALLAHRGGAPRPSIEGPLRPSIYACHSADFHAQPLGESGPTEAAPVRHHQVIDPVRYQDDQIRHRADLIPDRTSWRNNEREPGRWPDSRSNVPDMNDDAEHL